MPKKLDPFAAQLVEFVRHHMPDEAILELVRHHLGVSSGQVGGATGRGGSATTSAARPKKRAARKARGASNRSLARQRVVAAVEQIVKASSGLSASEIAAQAGVAQSRVASALRELKQAGRVHQGGDRRFARYAADPKTARAASDHARSNAGSTKGAGRAAKKTAGKAAKKRSKR
jgi:DNA-binding transcriptional ArsR family regulator